MDEETAKALDKLVERVDVALWAMEMGEFNSDVAKPSLYSRLIGDERDGIDCD